MWPAVAVVAFASVLSYPDEGSEPMGRSGAWVARASDPIALARNPAGLAGQPLRMSGGWDLPIRHACFESVCDTSEPVPVGFLTFAVPLTPRLSLGAGIVTPHGIARASWPMFVGTQPAPQRYLLLDSTTLFAVPTVGVAYEVLPDLRIGASVGWGLASVRTSAAAATSVGDYKVTILARDFFIPRATLGVHAQPSEFVEIGASFMASAPFSGSGEATTEANAFTERASRGDGSKIAHGFIENAELEVAIPAEASLGVRLRMPRGSSPRRGDPIDTEVADLEVDATWSNDSAIDRYDVRVIEGIRVERRFRDVVGFRIGGDVNVIPGALAVRAGTFVTPRAGAPGSTGLETMSGTRVGLSAGATARVQGKFDLSAAYLHVFIDDVGALSDGLDVMHLGVAYRF